MTFRVLFSIFSPFFYRRIAEVLEDYNTYLCAAIKKKNTLQVGIVTLF